MIRNCQDIGLKEARYCKRGGKYRFLKKHPVFYINTKQSIVYYINLDGMVSDINWSRLSASKADAKEVILSDVCACDFPVERGFYP